MIGPQLSAAPSDDLVQLALELAGSLDARTVMRRILERSLAVSAADRATLSSFHGERLVIEATVGVDGEVRWAGRDYGTDSLMRQPLVVELLSAKRTVLGGGFATSAAMPEFRGALERVRHTALVPILQEGNLTGMLVLSRLEDRPFTPSDVPNLNAFGALAGLALRNATLFEEATDTARRLQAAADAATDVAALQELPALLQRLIAHACEAGGADAGAVMRLEDGAGVIEATSGIAPEGSRWPLDADVRAAIAAGQPIQVTTAGAEVIEELAPYAAAYGHALVSPMRFSGEQLGIIVLGRSHGRPPFSAGDIAAMQQFATLAALVLHNGRLVHRLREAETMKSEFTNIAVHELRGPLAVVEGYAELLLEDGDRLDPAVVEQVATIRRQAAHARALTDDLLILARLESDDLGAAADPVPLRDAVEAAVDRAQPRAALQGSSSIEVHIDEDATAVGDRQLVARILGNLLSNAIAYARGPISVTVGATGDRATVRVEDAGPGIPDDERERVFARFQRGGSAHTVQGSGLGLYLSRECARRMGGDLVLESAESGPGSRFVLSLPRAMPGTTVPGAP